MPPPNKPIRTLSEGVINTLGDDHAYLERIRRGGEEGPHEPGSRFREKQVRVARTTTGLSCSTYPPPPANTYVVALGTPDYLDGCGNQPTQFEDYPSDSLRYAHDIRANATWIPPDTLVYVILAHDKWYIIATASTTGMICFELTTDRTRETNAGQLFGRSNGIVRDLFGAVPNQIGDSVELRFCERLWLGAVTGCYGEAVPTGGTNAGGKQIYVVVACVTLEHAVRFQITADRPPTTLDADVPATILKGLGAGNAVFPAATWKPQGFTVRYCGLDFPHALGPAGQGQRPGAIGTAKLDVDFENTTSNTTMRYLVDFSDQMTTRVRFDLTAPLCPFQSTGVPNPEPMNFHGFSQDPGAITVYDIHGHATRGGQAEAEWDESQSIWVVVQVTKEERSVLLAPEPDAQDPCALQQLKIQVETCEEPSDSVQFGFTDVLGNARLVLKENSQDPTLCPSVDLEGYNVKVLSCLPCVEVPEQGKETCEWTTLSTIALEKSQVIDECLRVACDANGVKHIEAHFAEICTFRVTPKDWEACIKIIRCDGNDPCSPTTAAMETEIPNEDPDPDEEQAVFTFMQPPIV